MAIYIASEVPLRTLPFDADKPAFHVIEVRPFDEIVKKHFSKPYVYYAGSYEGCGCGFQYGRQYPQLENDREEMEAADASRHAIEQYVRSALEAQSSVELYACWSGDEAKLPEASRVIDVPRFQDGFKERELVIVGRPPDSHPLRCAAPGTERDGGR
ncbi:MAG: hypothetical protein ACTHLZ_04140 [Tepidisphaeraceae bacterium]